MFGYGSLVAALPVRTASVRGRRTWGVAMDNAVDLPGYKHYEEPGTIIRPDVMVAFLDLEPGGEDGVNGVMFEAEDLAALDARERNYVREEVETSAGAAWAYVGSPAGRARRARGVAEGRCVVHRAYLMRVLSGFAGLGPGELERFERSTGVLPGPLVDLALVPHA